MKTNLKRVLSLVCALALCIGMLPMSALAADPENTYSDKETAQKETGVTAGKALTDNGDGTYTITLSVQGYTEEDSETTELPADIVLVVDTSNSMDMRVGRRQCGGTQFSPVRYGLIEGYECNSCGEFYWNNPGTCTNMIDINRLDVAKAAASEFVGGLLDTGTDVKIGLYDFSYVNSSTNISLTNDRDILMNGIENIDLPDDYYDGGTDYDVGLSGAEDILKQGDIDRQKFIVFLSDGQPDAGSGGVSYANRLKENGVTIFSVGIDTGSSGNAADALKNIASEDANRNKYFYAASSDGSSGDALTDILDQIRKTIESSVNAGTNAVMTDVINTDYFELVGQPQGVDVSRDNSTLTWDIGDITKDEKTVSFTVRLKEGVTIPEDAEELYTNRDVDLTFDSAMTGGKVHFDKGAIGDPTVGVTVITLTGNSDTVVYDGSSHTVEGYTVTPEGYTVTGYEASGRGTLPGEYPVVVSRTDDPVVVKDSDGDLVKGPYVIKTENGLLKITDRSTDPEDPNYQYEITVEANSGTVKYNGQVQSVSGLKKTQFEVAGHTYTVSGLSASVSGTDAGEYTVNVTGTAIVKDIDGNDVTRQFIVKTQPGQLTIEKRNVTLTSATDSKEYDGLPLTNDEVTVGGDGFVKGEVSDIRATGSVLYAGEQASNTITYVEGENFNAKNYEIVKNEGQLSITDRTNRYQIVVEAKSGTFTYDGTEKSVSGLVEYTFTFNDQQYTVEGLTAEAKAIDAGQYPVGVNGTAIVKDAHGKDVTKQFAVTSQPGQLLINKRDVTLTSADASKEYDGTPLTNDTVTVGGDGFVEGEGATYNVTGTQTLVGSSENYFTYELNAGTKAENYNITMVNGTLTVTSRAAQYEITVVAKSSTEKYDGTEKSVSGLVEDTFTVNGQQYTVEGLTAEAKGTDAGEYPVNVTGTPVVKDANGNEVTDQFSVKTESGKLTIEKRDVTLTSGSGTKVYDGLPLTNDEVTASGDGWATGEGATYTVTGSQTLPGSSENAFTYTLNAGTKAENYNIETKYGTLEVTERGQDPDHPLYEIDMYAKGDTVMYDGKEHRVEGFTTDTFTVNGVTYTVKGLTSRASGVDAGEYGVTLDGTPQVFDAEDNDVTDQFIVNVHPGTLTITKRNVTLISATDSKVYDGKPLTNAKVEVTGDGWAAGEGATYTVTGSQTIVGSSDNTFTYELNAGTKAENYNIIQKEGLLTVTNRPDDAKFEIDLVAKGDTVMYDGSEHSVSGFEQTIFLVKGNVYTVAGLTASASGTDAGEYGVILDGFAQVFDAEDNDVTDQFIVNVHPSTLTITKRDVTLTSADDKKEYDGTPLTNDEVTVDGDGWADGEGATYNVTGSRTLVGTAQNTFTYVLWENTNPDNYNITTVYGILEVTNRTAKYEITMVANSGTEKYDGTGKTISGFEDTTFEVEGNTYTVKGLESHASGIDAGEYGVTLDGFAQVFDEAGNDVTEQFIVNVRPGTLTIEKRNVTLTSATDSKVYDGEPLTNDEITVGGDGWADGEGADYTVTGTRTLVGSSDNVFTYTLKDGAKTENYNITLQFGTLTVTDRPADDKYVITVEANSGEFLYDGTEKSVSGLKETTFVVEGNTYTVEGLNAEAKGTEPGAYIAEVTGTAVVKDEEDHDVTAQFTVNEKDGLLFIYTEGLEVTKTVSQTAAREGDELTYTIKVTNGGNRKLDVEVSDSMWGPKYGITTVTVNDQADVALDAANGYVYVIRGLDGGETATITYTYKVTAEDVEAGSLTNAVTVTGGDEDDEDEITVWTKDTTITPADLTLYTGGTGYSGIIGNEDTGETVTGTGNGLPEPGYYINLPKELNDALLEALNLPEGTVLDLSQYVEFVYDYNEEQRNWQLERYDKDGASEANGNKIYRILPATVAGKDIPVRLVITGETVDGEVMSDKFDVDLNTALYRTYYMDIYGGDLEKDRIQLRIKDTGTELDGATCLIQPKTGGLTIRGVTGDEETAVVGTETDSGFQADVPEGTTYNINSSQIGVNDADNIRLLVDELVTDTGAGTSSSEVVDAVETKALAALNGAISAGDAKFDMQYLDLVDANNGHVYVTASAEVTITWPMPNDADENGKFYVVHFDGLDREFNGDEAVSKINESTPELLEATVVNGKIQFTTDSFSPFVLVYEEEDEPYVPPVDDDDDDRPAHRPHRPDRDDEPEELNTEDHVAYLIGFTDGTIRPEANISRAEVATIFFRLLTDEARETYWSQYSPYSDVKADAWYNNAVCTLSNMGILDGYPDGTFRPDAPITRSEFTKVAISFFDYAEGYYVYGGEFSDVTGAEWFASYLAAALDYGLIEGMPDGTFRPLNNISRAEACTIVNRTLGREPDGDHLLSRREMITWPDNSTSAWYYADMQEATNSHDYYWDEDDEVEEWTEKLEERDWAALERSWSNAYDAPGGEVMD